MIFQSSEENTGLEIIKNDPDDPCSDFTVRASITTCFGSFSVENTAVHIWGFDSFLPGFDRFLDIREGEVRLEMTEDCAITFFRWSAKGDIGVRVALCRYAILGTPGRRVPIMFSGAFPLDPEWVSLLRTELVGLVR